MSYHIVKAISIKEEEGKVYITGSDNNISPRTPYRHEYPTLSAMLVREGREAVEMQIFRDYENGNLQGGKNKWTRALAILRHLPEYKYFDWREDASSERRKTVEFEALLKKALSLKLPAEKYIVSKLIGIMPNLQTLYMKKLSNQRCSWTRDKEKSKIFCWAEDAEALKRYFIRSNAIQAYDRQALGISVGRPDRNNTGSDSWTIEKIKVAE